MKTFTICNLNRWMHLPGIIWGFIGAILVVALIMPAVAFSQTVNLGTAANFGILGGAAITGSSVVTGNVGTTAGGVAGVTVASGYTIYTYPNATVDAAKADLATAYNDAATRGGATVLAVGDYDLSTHGAFSPGVYSIGGNATMSTTVTLNGSGIYIFQITGYLNTAASLSLSSAAWTDVFWQVGNYAALGAGFNFAGTVMANNYITLGAGGAIMNGRLLSKTAYVTAAGATVGGSEILPVEMVSFTATANRMNAELRWSTATEVNNYGFEIQRRNVESANIAQWQKVGFVSGAGTSNSTREYSYADRGLAAGRYAYRIKQIDNGGLFKYFSTAEVEIGLVAKEFTLNQNYPNPFNPSTMIEFALAQNDKAVVKVFNILGQDVATLFDGIADAGKLYQVRFDASSMSSGMYYVRLESNGQSRMQKVVYMK